MIKLLLLVPGEVEALAAIEAGTKLVQGLPEPILIDAIASTDCTYDLLKASGLISNLTTNKDSVDSLIDQYEDQYDIVYNVSPKREDGVYYGERDKVKKLKDMERMLGKRIDTEVPSIPYTLFATVTANLEDLVATYYPDTSLSAVDSKPCIKAKKNDLLRIKRILHSLKDRHGDPIKNRYYCVFAINKDIYEENKSDIDDLVNILNIPCILINEYGNIYDSSEILSTIEQVALVQNEDCVMVFGTDWRALLGWVNNKYQTYQLLKSDADGSWLGIRSNRAIACSMERHPIGSLKKSFKSIVSFGLKDILKEVV